MRPPSPSSGSISPSEERGVVLIVVLWILGLLSVLAGSFAYSTQVGLRLADHQAAQAEARGIARGAVAYAAHRLAVSPRKPRIPPDGTPIERRLLGGEARIAVTNLAGLVNLNRAPRALLVRLLARVGVPPGRGNRLADRMMDWRDEDSVSRTRGAEAAAYREAGRRFGPKNGDFQSVAELTQVLGMPRGVAEELGKLLTPFGDRARVAPRNAPTEVLAAITGREPSSVREFTRQRGRAFRSRKPAPPFANSSPWLQDYRSSLYRVRIRARGHRGGVVSAVAVIDLQGATRADSAPYRLVEWREAQT